MIVSRLGPMRTHLLKHCLKFFTILFVCVGAADTTTIKSIEIDYSHLLFPIDRQGFEIPQAIVGGYVEYEGTDQIFVSLLIDGQSYSQPVDPKGQFSFLAYAGRAGNYQIEAWTHNPTATKGEKASLVINRKFDATAKKK